MKLDPDIHIVTHSVFFLKPGVTATFVIQYHLCRRDKWLGAANAVPLVCVLDHAPPSFVLGFTLHYMSCSATDDPNGSFGFELIRESTSAPRIFFLKKMLACLLSAMQLQILNFPAKTVLAFNQKGWLFPKEVDLSEEVKRFTCFVWHHQTEGRIVSAGFLIK